MRKFFIGKGEGEQDKKGTRHGQRRERKGKNGSVRENVL